MIRFAGFVALVLVILSILDYFGTIEILSAPLKMFSDALVRFGNALKEGINAR